MKLPPPEILSLVEVAEALASMPFNERQALARWNALKLLQRAARLSSSVAEKCQRLASCGRGFLNDVAVVEVNGSRRLTGLYQCGVRSSCIYCGNYLAQDNLKRINETLEAFKKEYPGGGFVFFTLTIPRSMTLDYSHENVKKWRESQLLLEESWAYFSSAFTSELREKLGWFNHVKKVEEVFSPGKWQPDKFSKTGKWGLSGAGVHKHIHGIGMLEGIDAYGLDELNVATFIFERWNKSVRFAVKKLRSEKLADLDWIDLRKKNVVTPPKREWSKDGEIQTIKGGVNAYFPADINSSGSYLEKLAGELALSIYKEGQGSFPAHALPLLYNTNLKKFAMKAFEFHILSSQGVHALEFGRIRKDGRNCGVDRYLREKHPGTPQPKVRKIMYLTTGRKFNTMVMSSETSHRKFMKSLDSPEEIQDKSGILRPVLDEEIAQEIEEEQRKQLMKMVAKGLLTKGHVDSPVVLEWIFEGSEELRETYKMKKPLGSIIIKPKQDKSFEEKWDDIEPRYEKKKRKKNKNKR